MLVYVKKWFESFRGLSKHNKEQKDFNSYVYLILCGILGDTISWKRPWLSSCLIIYISLIISLCAYLEIGFFEFLIKIMIIIILADALESWLKYKHRTKFLKKLAERETSTDIFKGPNKWFEKQGNYLFFIRETNPTKAFIILNCVFGIIFCFGKYVNGYLTLFVGTIIILTFNKILYPFIKRIVIKVQTLADSECELDSLLPDVTDVDLKELSVELENVPDEKQSLDYWKPEDANIDDNASDSSDSSSSIATNLSKEKLQRLDKSIETSDSSDDEYIPLVQQKERYQTTLKVEPEDTWGNMPLNLLRTIGGAVSNLYSGKEVQQKHIPSSSSSDGFEIIDKNDLL